MPKQEPEATRQEVYAAIDSERAYQESKWGDNHKAVSQYLYYAEDYLAEAKHLVARNSYENVRVEVTAIARKIAALMVKLMEQHGADRREGF